MHKILFVKAKSRLGLLNPPKGETHPNVGVEQGPDYVLSHEFLQEFSQKDVITYAFSAPELVQRELYYQQLAEDYAQLINFTISKLDVEDVLVTVGGDHSVSLASLAAVLKIHQADTTGLIIIDSHADLHTSLTTESGNFHGMWLRAACDTFPVDSIDQLVPKKISVHNMIYVGNLDIEPAEQKYIQKNNISVFSADQLKSSALDKKVSDFIKNMSHIHVSIDIDGFSYHYAPATGMLIKNGLVPDTIIPLLSKLGTHPSVSVDLVEVNPLLPDAEKTINLAQHLLRQILPQSHD